MELIELKDKAKFLFDNKITINITTKDRKFYNGLIIELHETLVVINDRVLGLTPIAFSEIKYLGRFIGK